MKTNSVRSLISASLMFCSTAATSTALAVAAPIAAVPALDPYLATVSAKVLSSGKNPKLFALSSLPGRDRTPILEDKPALKFAFFAGAAKASPLVFVVAGLGGTAEEGSALFIGDVLSRGGYNVAVVPNPFSWQFVLKRSRVAMPGFIPTETQELLDMMVEVRNCLARKSVTPSETSAVGYSLGAVHLGLLQLQMSRGEIKSEIHFKRLVLINPPLNIPYALDQIDNLERKKDEYSADQRTLLWGVMLHKVGSLGKPKKGGDYGVYVRNAISELKVSPHQAAFLIGESFRSSLTDLIFASQQVRDRGVLREPVGRFKRNSRMEEASGILYGQYMNDYMMPFWQDRRGTEYARTEFANQASLSRSVRALGKESSVRLIHNQDDFLTDSEDLKALDSELGSRSLVFRYGGHVGNLWSPAVQLALIQFLE
ncbi:MAG: hypothetical protein EOP06_00225 [Proteobacteria bacterium]|nr:MAG: hypothetical protein EOP06_00225 [Pseudomonadota bacterium]